MTKVARDIAERAAAGIKRRFLLAECRKTKIAAELGVNRATIARWLNTKDPDLSVFLDMSNAVGADPIEVLSAAINESALADKENARSGNCGR